MNGSIKLMLSALTLCALFFTTSFGCTLIVQPVTKFEPAEYVFTGRVVGMVGPFESKQFRGQAWGLRVEVRESVYLPLAPSGYFEVIPFELFADCSTVVTPKEKLVKYYPVGSSVKVIAREATLLPGKLEGGNIRLEISPRSWSNISRNDYEDGGQMADAHSVFDYKSFRQAAPADYVESLMPFRQAKVVLPHFELRKDLLRLRDAKSEDERVEILERLIYLPACCGFDYSRIAETHVKNPTLVRLLGEKRKEWINQSKQQ